jgi:hypothetical protein
MVTQALIAVTGSSETNRLLLLQALFPTIALVNTSLILMTVMQMALNEEEVIDTSCRNCNAISYLFCSSRKPNGYFNGIE